MRYLILLIPFLTFGQNYNNVKYNINNEEKLLVVSTELVDSTLDFILYAKQHKLDLSNLKELDVISIFRDDYEAYSFLIPAKHIIIREQTNYKYYDLFVWHELAHVLRNTNEHCNKCPLLIQPGKLVDKDLFVEKKYVYLTQLMNYIKDN